MIGSSAALSVSNIPWNGPTGTVVVGCVDGELRHQPRLSSSAPRAPCI